LSKRRIFLLYLGFLAILLAGTWFVLGQTGASRAFVANLLARVIRPEHFSLADAAVDLGGGVVTLRGLTVATPPSTAGGARMAVDRVEVGVETNPLGNPGRVRELTLTGLDLEIDLIDGRVPDLSSLWSQAPQPESSGEPTAPPPLLIRSSRLRLRLAEGRAPLEFRELELDLLPAEPDSPLLVLRGSMTGPGGTFRISGSGDVTTRTGRVMLQSTALVLSSELAANYHPRAGDLVAEFGAGGRIDEFSAWCEFAALADRAQPRLDLGWKLIASELRCDAPVFPYPIRGASLAVQGSSADDGTAVFRFEHSDDDGRLAARGELRDLFRGTPRGEVGVTASAMRVGPKIGRALTRIPEARRVWDALSPTSGEADAELRLLLPGGDEKPGFTMDLTLREVAARFVGFVAEDGTRVDGIPLALTAVSGRVQIGKSEIVLDDLRGRIDAGELTVRGRIGKTAADRTVQLHVSSERLTTSTAVRDAVAGLSPGVIDVWADYEPRGDVGLELDVRAERGTRPDLRLVLTPLGASAQWSGFPCRVESIEGRIEIADDQLHLDLQGQRLDAPVALRGRFTLSERAAPSPSPHAELALRTGPLPIDDELRHAMRVLSTSLGDSVERFALDGRVGITLTTWQPEPTDPFEFDVRADLSAASAHFALPIRSIEGPIFVHGSGQTATIELSGVRGAILQPGTEAATAFVQGTIETSSADSELDLTAVVRALRLDRTLGEALESMSIVDLDTWDLLRPSGRIDVVWRRTVRAADDDHQTMRIQLEGVGAEAEFLPAPAANVRGEVNIVDGLATLGELRGRMAGAEFTVLDGTIAHDGEATNLRIRVASDDFPLDARMANLLSGPMRSTWLDRDIDGRVAIRDLTVDLRMPDRADGFSTRLAGRLIAKGVSASLGTELRDFRGTLAIDDAHFDLLGGRVRGSLAAASFGLLAISAEDVSARFDADAQSVRFSSLLGRTFGGSFATIDSKEGDLVYRFAAPGTLSFGLRWNDIDLARVMRGARNLRGSVSGEFHLERLQGTDLVDLRGTGKVAIRGGDLGAVPAFTAIYSYLPESRRPRFDSFSATLAIAERKVDIESLELSSPLLSATGRGNVDLAGWIDMRIDFPDLFGKDADILVIPGVLRSVASGLAQFQIHGELRNPRVRPLWIGREAAGTVPLGPLPASKRDDR
jgi:hypothetical protein